MIALAYQAADGSCRKKINAEVYQFESQREDVPNMNPLRNIKECPWVKRYW